MPDFMQRPQFIVDQVAGPVIPRSDKAEFQILSNQNNNNFAQNEFENQNINNNNIINMNNYNKPSGFAGLPPQMPPVNRQVHQINGGENERERRLRLREEERKRRNQGGGDGISYGAAQEMPPQMIVP